MRLLRLTLLVFGSLLMVLTLMMSVLRREPSEAYWLVFKGYPIGDQTEENAALYRIAPDGSKLAKVLDSHFEVFAAIWSPNSSWFIVWAQYDNGTFDLYHVNANDQTVRWLTTSGASSDEPSISPDGQWVVYIRHGGRYGEPLGLLAIRIDKSRQKQLVDAASFYEQNVRWSPTGEWIVFTEYDDGRDAVFHVRPNGSDLLQIAQYPYIIRNLVWSPNGEWIAVVSEHGISRIRPDGSEQQYMSNLTIRPASITWSPDSQWIAADDQYGQSSSIVIFKPDGSDLQAITFEDLYRISPIWSPDGRWIYFISFDTIDNPRNGIYRMHRDGSDVQQLAIDVEVEPDFAPIISPLFDLPFHASQQIIITVISLFIGSDIGSNMWRRIMQEPASTI